MVRIAGPLAAVMLCGLTFPAPDAAAGPPALIEPVVKVIPTDDPTELGPYRQVLVGPGLNEPEPYPGYTGFYGWEGIARTRTGALLLTFSSGYWHGSPPTPLGDGEKALLKKYGVAEVDAPRGGRAHIMRSEDGGRTWSKPSLLIDTPGDDRAPAPVQLSDGTLLCSFFIWPPKCAAVIRSTDDGRTWEQEPRRLRGPFKWTGGDGPPIELPDGSVLMVVYAGHGEEDGKMQQAIFRSTDRGATWEHHATLDAPFNLDEPHIAALADGRLITICRREGAVAWSEDQGQTWTAPVPLPFKIYDPWLLPLRDGTLLCVHGSYAEGKRGLRAILSPDGGKTWHAAGRDFGFGIDPTVYGYSRGVELDDGSVYLVTMANGGHKPEHMKTQKIYAIRLRVKPGCSGIELLPAPGSSDSPSPSPSPPGPADEYKAQVVRDVEGMKKQAQVMNDMVFSFGELGFQEVETSKYLTGILEKEGFAVERGIAGIPTAWMATWGSGKPVIALGSDIDCIPQASQKPGVPRHEPLIEGAPGHGEGHNSGQPLNITAAIAVKRLMERAGLKGTLKLWPGVAEEQLGTKAYLVREGYFRDVDVVLFTHVGSDFSVSWGPSNTTGLVSVEYTFQGESAHAGSAPWRGRSALDAVELMNIGWNFRREHLRTQQRSHYVITGGGDQPNVVPPVASVWYYFRELDDTHIRRMREIGDAISRGAAAMTETTVSSRVLGSAWPQHFNRPVAEAMAKNIEQVGMPRWSAADQALAKAVQRELKQAERGLETRLKPLAGPVGEAGMTRGGSDDIGDVSWTVPTVTLRYPANIPDLPGHHWSNAIAMATPIAHQGVMAGAKALAMTMVDLLVRPALVADARGYFRDVQTKDTTYRPLISTGDRPAVWLNKKTMDNYRERMRKFYYDPAAHDTYLKQLGIGYPDERGAAPASSAER